ncbi:hypothetical protein NIES2100_66420 [Calothrix sp. NIES-2100]|uniref:hypothetical protein n=1 Tax=Calothrix sp. NIES-2100 TaxID=1954172 RepID=UPI000B5FEAE6|nr:hypothetical protein NIES2100_66420 [Calothrix sp. NIES-2100]
MVRKSFFSKPKPEIIETSLMEICIIDNNGNYVRPWLTTAMSPDSGRIMWCRLSLERPGQHFNSAPTIGG